MVKAFYEKSVSRKVGVTFILKIIGALLAFGSQIAFAKLLSPSQYGLYTFVFSWVALLIIPAKMGYDVATLRFVAAYTSTTDQRSLTEFIKVSSGHIRVFSLIIALLGVLLVVTTDVISQNKVLWILAFTFLVPLTAQNDLQRYRLQALGRIKDSLYPEVIIKHLFITGSLFLIYQFTDQAITATMALIVSIICFIIVSYSYHRSLNKTTVNKGEGEVRVDYSNLTWLKIALPLSFVSALQFIMNQTDILMVGYFIDKEQVAFYTAAAKITLLVSFGLQTSNIVLAPEIAKLYAKGHIESLKQRLFSFSTVLSISTILIVIFIFFEGEWILSLFGEAYTVGFPCLLILSLGNLVNVMTGSVGYLLSMTGHQNLSFKITLVSSALNILLNCILIPYQGVVGAAIATSIAIAVRNVGMLYFVWKHLRINPTVFNPLYVKKLLIAR